MTPSLRRAGIISAGDGLRLQGTYGDRIKPMIPIGGVPLIHWVVSSLQRAGMQEITLLTNSRGTSAQKYVQENFKGLRWRCLTQDTRSSWESFRLVSERLGRHPEPFLVSTVDILISPRELARFAKTAFSAFESTGNVPLAALAVTPFVEDEKPLWADLDSQGRVTALGSDAAKRKYVTCGLYAMSRAAVKTLPSVARFGRLREYWTEAVREKRNILGVVMDKTVDVDRPQDLATAEAFVPMLQTAQR